MPTNLCFTFLITLNSLELPEKLSVSIILLNLTYVATQVRLSCEFSVLVFFVIPLSIIRGICPSVMDEFRNRKLSFRLTPVRSGIVRLV